MSIIGGIGFLYLGIWLETIQNWQNDFYILLGVDLIVAVFATTLSYHWLPRRSKLEK
jgi:hypothetical protein